MILTIEQINKIEHDNMFPLTHFVDKIPLGVGEIYQIMIQFGCKPEQCKSWSQRKCIFF